jgi:hypothetical protein
MFIGSHIEIEFQFFKAHIQIGKQLFNSFKQLLDWSLGEGVELHEVKQGGPVG